MREGLPKAGHYTILSPILWLCHSNDIAPSLRQHEVQIGMHADDVVIHASERDVVTAQEKVQAAVSEIHEWARPGT